MASDKLFQLNRERKAEEIARRTAKKSPYETALIVCEGEKTEVNYFNGLRTAYKLNTANIIVSPSKGSAPISIVEFAIETAESKPGIDKVFCVFDRDEHKSYQQAIDKIKNHKPNRKAKSRPSYQSIASFPCFEFWLLLHFNYTTKAYSRIGNNSACDCLINDLCQHLPEYAKNAKNLFEQLDKNTQEAITNGKKLKSENEKTGSINPATNIHELVEYLINLKK